MATRDTYKQRKYYINYKLCRNKVVQMITEAKTVYYRNIIEENRHDTRALVSWRNDSTSTMPKTVKSGDIDVTDPIDIAQTFNQLFSIIAEYLVITMSNSTTSKL